MKNLWIALFSFLIVFTACTPTTTTNPPAADSLATAKVDSPLVVNDAATVATVPGDSAATQPATDASTAPVADGKMANNNAKGSPIVASNRMTISFISMGGGIDHKGKATFEKFVATYEINNKVKLAHETVGWGKEGEVDFCYKLVELKEPKRTDFVNQCKVQVKGNELIQLKENAPCRVPRK